MKVSIAMITYNHEKFIAKALDSILMQQVNFEYEIVIGEDCSTDSTRDIVINYQNHYPEKIRLLLPETNLGMLKNFVQTLSACQGEYIALLEGDDYWTSPNKLQKQVNFMDNHPNYATCFHNVTVVYENGKLDAGNCCRLYQKEIFTLEDLMLENFIETCSTMFRRGLFSEFPDWFFTLKQGDWPLHIFNAEYGNIGYINEVMGVYRIHQGGVWSKQSDIWQTQESIRCLQCIKGYLNCKYNFKYQKDMKSSISYQYYWLARTYIFDGDLAQAIASIIKSFTELPFNKHLFDSKRLKALLGLYAPGLFNSLRFIRNSTSALSCSTDKAQRRSQRTSQ